MGNKPISRRSLLSSAGRASAFGLMAGVGLQQETDGVKAAVVAPPPGGCADYVVKEECTCVDLDEQCDDGGPNRPPLYYEVHWEYRDYCDDSNNGWYAAEANCGYTYDCDRPKCNSDSDPC